MLKILTIVGARPQIIKASALSRAIKTQFKERISEIILHTGQHYDENMSQIFFDELDIPKPDYNLEIGSGSHAKQTADMMIGIEDILLKEKPDCIVVYGDTNSTLAGALAASKIHVPVVHVEAGLRSFNKKMPEEINRISCDHVSYLLFSPTQTGYDNLLREGFINGGMSDENTPFDMDYPRIFHCGDVMFDNSLHFSELASKKSNILKKHDLQRENYALATIHRNNNTDQPKRLASIFSAIDEISKENNLDVILPLHPRTNKAIEQSKENYGHLLTNPRIKIIDPVSFLDMIQLEKNALLVLTDSGGVQKEAYFFQKPCIILRSETEWKEIISEGAAIVCDADKAKIKAAFNYFKQSMNLNFPQLFGEGNAAQFICEQMLKFIPKNNA